MRLVSSCADVKLFAAPELDRKGLSEPLSARHTRAHVLSVPGAQEACCGMASSLGKCKKSAGFIHELNHFKTERPKYGYDRPNYRVTIYKNFFCRLSKKMYKYNIRGTFFELSTMVVSSISL